MIGTRRPGTQWLIVIAAPVLAWLALAAWAFASPVGSSPDDDFHLAAIWCGQGNRDGLCEPVDESPARSVPTALLTSPCFAFHPDTDASCWDAAVPGMSVTARANADGLYPPLFYSAMSRLASTDVQMSVILMRLANVTIAVSLLTAVFWALPRRLRPALLVSVIASAIPLGVFVLASTNPSSWAFLSAATVWICLYGSLLTSGRRSALLSALAVIGAVLGAGARADAAVFAVFGAVLALFLGFRQIRRTPVALIASVVILAVSVSFYLGARQGGAAWSGLDHTTERLTLAQHLSNLLQTPSLWVGALGRTGLGWLDTDMTAAVWVLTTMVFAGAIFIGVRGASWQHSAATVAALAAMWLVPLVMLAQSNTIVGAAVQPRYLLPLLVIALGVSSLRFDIESAWDGMRYGIGATCLTIAFSVALHQNIRRYTAGATNEALDPGADAAWWWTGAPAPLAVWIAGSIAFATMLAVIWWAKARPRADISEADTADRLAIL